METDITTEFRKELVAQGFVEYVHTSGFKVWSQTDLFATDYLKEWFLA